MRNKFEASIAKQLKRAKVKFEYETKKIPYILARHYIPDFVIECPNGYIYIEAKGYLRPEAKAKMAAVKRQHPEMDIRFLFFSERKGQIRWAEKHGFKWAIGKIPREWLEGL